MSSIPTNQQEVVTTQNLEFYIEKMRKLFMDEIPYSKENFTLVLGVKHNEIEAKYGEYIKLFPKEDAAQRATESVAHFLDHSMHRRIINDYETEILDDAVAFAVELISSEKVVVFFGIDEVNLNEKN